MNLEQTIIPKSDQLNADDLIAGPRTITITDVTKGSPEQPVSIHYQGEDGRPYKPGKSMRRVLVAMWGSDSAAYVGRRLTLYRDPAIRFGGDAVGGIRISHASDLPEPMVIALTETRGKRKPFKVVPLPPTPKATSARAEQAQAADPDASLDEAIWAAEAVGEGKAREGVAALREWWLTLPKGVQAALKPKLDGEWKPLADGGAK
jgi:hypothetical protein